MGQKNDAFEKAVREIIAKHLPGIAVQYDSRPSGTGKYLAITATFTATGREQLDALYRELNNHELVVMTL
jgi:putative lipoic acid-binding regulatory protein